MTPEQISLYQGILKTLESVKYGKKQAYLSEVCGQIGVTMQALYRNLEAVGYKSGKKTREDKGTTTVCLEDARLICGMIYHTQRKNEKRLLSTERAIEKAYANNMIKSKYSASSVMRVAEANGFHPSQLRNPTPHQNMASLHPNHVWQVDASIGTLFYLPKGGVEFFDEREHYKNKPQNIEKARNHLCIRYAATDHYSGAIYVKFYSATGETQEILFDFLVSAFLHKQKVVMNGVPFMLVMDKGAANTAHSVCAFLDKMQVINYAHAVGNSRAKGQVEKAQDIIERDFEGGLRLMHTPVKDVDELNALAEKWMVYYNSTKIHSRHKATRWGMWQTIAKEHLRLAPAREVMEMLFNSKPLSRTVAGDLTISFKIKGVDESYRYSVEHIPSIKVKDEVLVSVNPYRSPNVDVIVSDIGGKETYYECTPLLTNEAGFYVDAAVFGEEMKRPADTITDIERKQGMKAAYDGAETLTEAKAKQKKGTQLFAGKIDPFKHMTDAVLPEFMQRKGTEMGINAPSQVFEPISVAEACKRIKAEMGAAYPADTYAVLSAKHKEGVDPLQIDQIIADLKHPVPQLKII